MKFFSFKFDTTRNTTISVLKLVGMPLVGLFFLGLIIAPFTDTEIRESKQNTTTEEQRENNSAKQKDNVDEQQVAKTSVSATSSDENVSQPAIKTLNEQSSNESIINSQSTNSVTSNGKNANQSANQNSSERATNSQSTNADTAGGSNNIVTETSLYQVIKVVDGDTIDVSIAGKTERIRIIGLDTPETVDPRQTIECFGLEASAKAKELLLNKQVRLEADPTQGERGSYGRLLRYVFLADGRNYALEMIKQGYGHEYTYNVPHKHQKAFQEAEKEAKNAKRGLWAPDACIEQETEETESPEPDNNPSANCHPAYEPCLPIVGDLNCSDDEIKGPITVKNPGVDPYRLDGDNNGTGCESS